MGYSVLTSVYEKEKPQFLRASIESMLAQTVPPSDYVIVCDGPLNEGLDAVIREYENRAQKLFQIIRLSENVGLGAALNEGMRFCREELIARMDSDDISRPERCERQLSVFEGQDVDIVSGTVEEFEGDITNVYASRELPEKHEDLLAFSKKRNPFNHPAVMVRRDKVQEAGGFRPFAYFEDYDLWVRMLMRGCRGFNIKEPILYMRAGRGMYARRGGAAYAGCIWRFWHELKRIGYVSTTQFLSSAMPHIAVALMPNGLRKIVYGKLLRGEAKAEGIADE